MINYMNESENYISPEDYHKMTPEYLSSLSQEIGDFDLQPIIDQLQASFQSTHFELQKVLGPGLRLILHDTPDIMKRQVVHLEIWINHQNSKEAQLIIYIPAEKYDTEKLKLVIDKYGGEHTDLNRVGVQIKIPIKFEEGQLINITASAKSIYDELMDCSI